MQKSVKIGFVFFGVQSEGSPTAFTEVTGRNMICDIWLCSLQGSIVERGVTRSGQFLVSIFSYIYRTELCRAHQYTGRGGCREGSVP